jgi:hypothetical protein
MAQQALLSYGQSLLSFCKHKRYYGPFVSDMHDRERVLTEIATLLSMPLDHYRCEWIERTTTDGFSMKWHCDDAAVIKTKNQGDTGGIMLTPRYKLYHTQPLPAFTAILYASEYGTDFTGGEFEFVDQQILPRRHHVLVFDSREVHRVLPVTSGLRKSVVLKWYTS